MSLRRAFSILVLCATLIVSFVSANPGASLAEYERPNANASLIFYAKTCDDCNPANCVAIGGANESGDCYVVKTHRVQCVCYAPTNAATPCLSILTQLSCHQNGSRCKWLNSVGACFPSDAPLPTNSCAKYAKRVACVRKRRCSWWRGSCYAFTRNG